MVPFKRCWAGVVSAVIVVALTASTASASELASFAYVTFTDSPRVEVINLSTNKLVDVLELTDSAEGGSDSVEDVAIMPNGAFAYISAQGPAAVWVLNTATDAVVTRITLPASFRSDQAHGVAMSPDGAFVYVTNTETR